jgi:hypothetical protein
MGGLKSESLVWLDQLTALRAQKPDASRDELKKALKLGDTQISGLQNLDDCLDPAAIEKIRQAANGTLPSASNALGQSNPVAQLGASQQMQILSFKRAVALATLAIKIDKVDLHTHFHAALDVTLALRLAPKKIKTLVKWIVSGKPASEFDPNLKDTQEDETEEETGENQTGKTSALDLKKLRQLLEKAEAEKALGKGIAALKKLEKYLQSLYSSASLPEPSQNAKGSKKGFTETIMLDWLADIKIIQKIKSKIKKGQDITKGEVAFLWLHKGGELLGHGVKIVLKVLKLIFKPFFKIIHWSWKMVEEALKDLGLYKYAKAIFTLVVLIAVIWLTWEVFHYGVMRPVEIVWSKIHFRHAEDTPTAVPTPQSLVSIASPSPAEISSPSHKTSASRKGQPPVVAYIPSVSFKPTAYDPKLLEQEIAAIPDNSVIKDYVFQPDEGMPADLAVSRLQDLTDPDKYTMMIGGGKQKILSVTPSNTNFIIAYKSTDLFGVFGDGSGQMNIFLEDVQYIHINEIDHFSKPGAQPDIRYQCTVVAKGEKNPLTIQCGSADDLENLVSTLEYFIRHSRLAHDAQPGGLPYPTQGIKLNNDRVVTLLWTNSPADRAGVGLGDHLWSVEKITSDQQSRKDLETGLQILPATLFAASPAEWEKAQIARGPNLANALQPKLRKVILNASQNK